MQPVTEVAEWYRYRILARLVTSSRLVPLKTRRVGQRCTLNLSRAETSSRWCGGDWWCRARRGNAVKTRSVEQAVVSRPLPKIIQAGATKAHKMALLRNAVINKIEIYGPLKGYDSTF
ncbi:hypothetical protein TNCV_926481 [Trichonephila clavipes]|nr:hypothetical protein TNCV_926481 [Trichonephila clavipes]